MQARVSEANDGPLVWLADALRELWNAEADEAPFAVAVMRGGMPRDNDWARRPDQPVLGVSTVDQVGSRLLFRGYGVGSRSAPIHAGLIGNDTLILLDEVHLAVPFAQTLEVIRARHRPSIVGLPDRFALVQMSATPGARATFQRFALEEVDRLHPVLGQRLVASKEARLVPVKVAGKDEDKKRRVLAEHAVGEALGLQAQGARVIGLVVNRVDTARIALQLLESHASTTQAILVTGRMRPVHRDHIVHKALVPHAGAGRVRAEDRSLVVVATQCIEAGADLDFDGIVTECASIDALRQRFGRVDRRGELRRSSSVVLARSDQIAEDADDPIYGQALAATWKWLEELAEDGVVDLGIGALAARSIPDDLVARPQTAPVLLPAHLDAWAQTSPLPAADPDVALWLHGPKKDVADVQIVLAGRSRAGGAVRGAG